MPKILINEKDKTSPGTPGSYANYSVLITGFTGTPSTTEGAKIIEPDANGVYEFNSVGEFKDTIGLRGPRITRSYQSSNGTAEEVVYHYGNQMAYELLNLGYPVIYKPLVCDNVTSTALEAINELTETSFWEIFKDKASYDFRFVTHGLLNSSVPAEQATALATNEAELALVNKAFKWLEDTRMELGITISQIADAEDASDELVTDPTDEQEANQDFENSQKLLEAYQTLHDTILQSSNSSDKEYGGFFDKENNTPYTTYFTARTALSARIAALETAINNTLQAYITASTINKANGVIANLAQYVASTSDSAELPGRGDCIALIELDESSYTNIAGGTPETQIITAINKMSQINTNNGKYCAMTVPSVIYNMTEDPLFDNNKKFPGAFHYLACFARSINSGFAEWYAAAGYTRGVASYIIDHTTVKLGEIAINALEPRNIVNQSTEPKFACNVIANFRGSYYLWGNRTAHELGSKAGGNDLVASHFLNIRQLCTTIKKQLYVACRRFTFDPNSDTLWVNFCNAIRPTLEVMKADQGIRDYKIIKVYTDKKATLKAKIRIIPIEAVEDFDLEVSLEDSFGETTAVVTE